jgi:tripartite-type tricarboxylate transporter receptor subunit TctC
MDNRPGAGGSLATELLAKAEPDGYTLMVGMAGPISSVRTSTRTFRTGRTGM